MISFGERERFIDASALPELLEMLPECIDHRCVRTSASHSGERHRHGPAVTGERDEAACRDVGLHDGPGHDREAKTCVERGE
jgi:hypothetical protein